MRLCIPVSQAAMGGMGSFFGNFRAYLRAAGVPFTDRVDVEADVLIASSWVVPAGVVARVKRRWPALRVLHRIDGSAADYGREGLADVRQALVSLLADATVFQSAYGREATRRRRIVLQDGPVVHNAVDVERFRPDGPRVELPGRVRVAHVAFSTNPRKGSAAVYALARRRPDVSFVMIGRYEGPPALDNLRLLGVADRERLPVLLRSCDLLLFLAENETCPNVVLEGMATGLPVIYRASGGTAELVGDAGVAAEPATFDRALEEAMDRREALGAESRRRAVECFAPGVVFPRYLAAAEGAVRHPLPGPLGPLRVLANVRPSPTAVAGWLLGRVRGRRRAGAIPA